VRAAEDVENARLQWASAAETAWEALNSENLDYMLNLDDAFAYEKDSDSEDDFDTPENVLGEQWEASPLAGLASQEDESFNKDELVVLTPVERAPPASSPASPPTSPVVDPREAEADAVIAQYYNRYDLDESGFIDTQEEFSQLCTNVFYGVQVKAAKRGGTSGNSDKLRADMARLESVIEAKAKEIGPRNAIDLAHFTAWWKSEFPLYETVQEPAAPTNQVHKTVEI